MTFAAIWSVIRLLGFFVYDHWKIVLSAVLLVLLVVLVHKACKPKPATIDIKSIDKINKANETDRKAELQKVIEQNADVVKTVDQRNTIAGSDENTRNVEIYAKIAEADRKIAEAKAGGKDVTQEQLQCILVPSDCPQ